MKEATGELNMTIVTIVAIGVVLGFVTVFLPGILDSISGGWESSTDMDVTPYESKQNSGQ